MLIIDYWSEAPNVRFVIPLHINLSSTAMLPLMNFRMRAAMLVCAATVASCTDASHPAGPVAISSLLPNPTASFSLADGANGGNTRFWFLPPLVENPGIGPANSTAIFPALRVDVCVLQGSACVAGPPVARFLPVPREGAAGLRKDDDGIRLTGNHYEAVWETARSTDAASDYRVTVFAGDVELGHADVDVLDGKVKKSGRPGYVAVKAGDRLLIPFRVRDGVIRTLTIAPATAVLAPGGTVALVPTALDYEGQPATGRAITWVTSNPQVATVSASGVVTATGPGTVTITAWMEGVTASATITVRSAVASISLAPSTPLLVDNGGTAQLVLTALDGSGAPVTSGISPVWMSSDPSRATVTPGTPSSFSATVTGLASGSVTVTVSIPGTSLSRSVAVTVLAPPLAVAAGEQTLLRAADLLGPGVPLTSLTWTSSAPTTMSVSPNGLVTPLAVGFVTITVTAQLPGGGVATGSIQLTSQLPGWCVIKPTIQILPAAFQVLFVGQPSVQLTTNLAAGASLSWVSGVQGDLQPYSLSPLGVLTPLKPGFGTMNAIIPGSNTYGTGCVVIIGAYVDPGPAPTGIRIVTVPTLPVLTISPTGLVQSTVVSAEVVDATGARIPGTFPFQWSSGNSSVMTVVPNGASATITAVAGGMASLNVSAVLPTGNFSKTVLVTVDDQRPALPGPGVVTVTASSALRLTAGQSVQLTATTSGAQPNPANILWASTSPDWLAIDGPTTGSTITVRNTGLVPVAAAIQVNVTLTANGKPGSGFIAVPIAP